MPNLVNIGKSNRGSEQEAFVQWLRPKGYPHFRVPNETYTKSWSQSKNKKLGVSPGVRIYLWQCPSASTSNHRL